LKKGTKGKKEDILAPKLKGEEVDDRIVLAVGGPRTSSKGIN